MTVHQSLWLGSMGRWGTRVALGMILGLWGAGWAVRVEAAEYLTLRWGWLSQTVRVADLETFADTGQVPAGLWGYRPFLNDQVRATLQSSLVVDPAVGQVILDEILHTPGGKPILATLQALAPNLHLTDLQKALEQVAGLGTPPTLMAVLRQLPQETLTLDVGAGVAWASQFQLTQRESTLLGHVLRHEMGPGVGYETGRPVDPAGWPSPANPFMAGAAPVERWDIRLWDRQRNRRIPIDIYWSKATHGPLVVMSHGFGADRRFLAYLAEHLASHGLTVVAIEHPGSNVAALFSLPQPGHPVATQGSRLLPATEFLDRPRDITYVLDRLAHFNRSSSSLHGRFNTDQVTLIGHSLGGYTGLALAGAPLDLRQLPQVCEQVDPVRLVPSDWFQCAALELPVQYANLHDPRIRQLILANPLTGRLFGETGLSQVTVPTLVLAGTEDSVTPMADQQMVLFNQLAGPKYLITALGGSHLSVGDPHTLNPTLQTIPFMPELPSAQTHNLRVFLQGMSLSLILQQTDQAPAYADFLTPAYAEAFSTPDLGLGLNQTLSPQLLAWSQWHHQRGGPQSSRIAYGPSLLRLQAMLWQDQVSNLQDRLITTLKTSPSAMPAIPWPTLSQHQPIQASAPEPRPTPP